MDSDGTEGKTWCIFGHHYPAMRGGGVAHWVDTFMEKEGWFDTGLRRFTLTFVQHGPYVPAHLGSGAVVRDGSDGQRAKWEAYMAQLPTRKFGPKRRELDLTLRGDPGLDFSDRHYLVNLSVEHLRIGTAMVLRALESAQTSFKRSDLVNLKPMISNAKDLQARSWPDDEAMRADLRLAHDLDRAWIAAMNPWAKIDLRGFHPKARKILDQPSDWSEVDDFSPHGNDLGADILGDWPRMKGLSVNEVALRLQVDLTSDDAEASMARIQISLALAFGHIKKSADCPAHIAQETLQDFQTHRARAAALVVPNHLDRWVSSCDRFTAILQRYL